MPKLEDLLAVAYKADLALSRRLQKNSGLSAHQALRQVLQQAAGDRPLGELLQQRRQIKLDTAHKRDLRRQARAAALTQKQRDRQPDATAWQAWFDGATHPNPGRIGVGGVLKSPGGQIIRISFAAGQGNSSEGEYLALIAVLQEAVRRQPEKLQVYGDSRVVIDDVRQAGNKGASGLQHYCIEVRQLLMQLKTVTLTWIPRHRNAEADALSQQAIASIAPGGRIGG